MKALLHFRTALGPRTVVAEIGDAVTAQAVVNAHLALGEQAALVEEMPRLTVKELVARKKPSTSKPKAALPNNVTKLVKKVRG